MNINLYKTIPGFSRYKISEEGSVWSSIQNRIIHGYITPKGYCKFTILSDLGNKVCVGRHRLICMVFKPIPNFSDFEVNHINDKPGDDRLANLEWCTPQENVQHAHRNGKCNYATPVQTRCVKTGGVTNYVSMNACGRANRLDKDKVRRRMDLGPYRVWPDFNQYRYTTEKPWPDVDIEQQLLLNGTSKKVLCRDLETNTVKEFNSVGELATYLGIKISTASTWLNKPAQPVLQGFIQVKYKMDKSPWRNMEDYYLDYNSTSKLSAVVKVVTRDGNIHMFSTAGECAKQYKLKKAALNYRLKSKGLVIFSDGNRYGYYPY